jgi:hypothetical protein
MTVELPLQSASVTPVDVDGEPLLPGFSERGRADARDDRPFDSGG